MATYEEMMAKAKQLAAGGDTASAKRLAQIALKSRSAPTPEKGIWQTLKENVVGDNDPTTMNTGEKIGTLLNMGGESMTFGLVGDEAAAAADSVIGRGNYDDRLAKYRGNEASVRESNPGASLAADVLPALLPGLGMAKGVAAAPSALGALWRGAKAGIAAGGTYGFMEGEGGLGDRIQGGAVGATLGGAIGAATPALAGLAQKAWRAGAEGLANRNLGIQAGAALGVNPKAARVLAQDVLALDDPNAMRAAMAKAGPNAMLADSGPMAQGALDASMRAPGTAARTAMTRIDDRAASALRGVTGEMDISMGAPKGVNTAQAGVRTSTAGARKTTYDAAYATPIDYSAKEGRALESVLPRIPNDVISAANRLMQVDGDVSNQIMASIGPNGKVTYQRMPDVRQWDYIKRALDQAASTGDGQGALGGQTPMGNAYQGLAKTIRNSLKAAVPEYGVALETAADAISRVKGIEFGAKLLRRETTRESVADFIDGATGPEMAAIRQGARSQIDEVLANVRAVASDQNIDARQAQAALAAMSSPASKTKLKMILGDTWPALEKKLDESASALGLRARVAANSATMGRTAFDNSLNDALDPTFRRAGFDPMGAAREIGATVMGASPSAVNRLRADAKGGIADILTRQGEGPQILQLLESLGQKNAVSPQAGTALAELLRTALLGNTGNLSQAPFLQGLLGR
jgi:hypothetical protein